MVLFDRMRVQRTRRSVEQSSSARSQEAIWILIALALAYAGYFVLRYGGLWTENDTQQFALLAEGTAKSGTVLFAGQYAHGFGFPSWLAALSLLTGMPIPVLNTVVLPYAGAVFLILAAFVAYRALLGSQRAALLATVLLFSVPDLLFSVLRGNHEKLDISFMLLSMFVLFKGFAAMGRGNAMTLAFWAILFYALVLGNAIVNDYFASTLVTASTLTLVIGSALTRGRPEMGSRRPALARFTIVVAVSWLIVGLVALFIFPPAAQDFKLLTTTADKVRSLFLTLAPSSNPYSIAAQQWASPLTAKIISAFRWIVLGGSFLVWLVKVWDVVVRGARPSLERLFLLSLYGAFGTIMAISIPVDLVGLYAGSNLELRNFTYFALLCIPVLAWGLRDVAAALRSRDRRREHWGDRARSSGGSAHRLFQFGAGGAFVVVSLAGLLKSTVDPALSNEWIFYSPAEHQAIAFFEHGGRSDTLWTGPDARLTNMAAQRNPDARHYNLVEAYALLPSDRVWLRSPQVVANSTAYQTVVPPYDDQNRIYDNGEAQLYRMTPRTQFQN